MIKGDGTEPVRQKHSKALCGGDDIKVKQLAIRDVVELLSGKWKVQIIGVLCFSGKMRFMDLIREVDGIAAKMLSKELQDLETNKLVTRTVMNTKPITVEYEITEYGKTLRQVLQEMVEWGMIHRRKIMGDGGDGL
jgi:DNA-binding HxlR family transcriptional regulator